MRFSGFYFCFWPGTGFRLLLALVFLAVGWGETAQAAPGRASFPIPSPDSQPISITLGPDGNLWFTEQARSRIARITPKGVITEFVTPTFSFPLGITAGPDGNVWFTEGSGGQIGFITPKGRIVEIPFDSSGLAAGIVTGPDGNIWFVDATGNKVWRLELPARILTSFAIPTPNSFPNDITVGGDGNLWFTESDRIGRITTDGVITEFGSGLGLPFSIAAGPDGNVWFTQRFLPEIGKITPSGDFTFYPIPANAEQITPGLDELFFTEFGSDRIGSITTGGVVTESGTFPNAGPTGIVAGTERRIWFLGYGSNRVYRISFGP
ncbi:MAG: Virginiamycin B lyase [Chthoniobacterales bacterium]